MLGLVGASTLAFGVTAAQASITIGSPTQTNNQSSTTGQVAAQNVGGGLIVGDVSQTGHNTSTTDLDNSQSLGGGVCAVAITCSGAVVVGSPSQSNTQTGGTSQTLDQQTPPATSPGGVHIGDTSQTGSNTSHTDASNHQSVGSEDCIFVVTCPGAVVVGSPHQSNTQNLTTGQLIAQNAGGTGGVIIGDVSQDAHNNSTSDAHNGQSVGGGVCIFAITCSAAVLIGSPVQSSNQPVGTSQVIGQGAAGGVIVGGALGISQTQGNTSHSDVTSHATS